MLINDLSHETILRPKCTCLTSWKNPIRTGLELKTSRTWPLWINVKWSKFASCDLSSDTNVVLTVWIHLCYTERPQCHIQLVAVANDLVLNMCFIYRPTSTQVFCHIIIYYNDHTLLSNYIHIPSKPHVQWYLDSRTDIIYNVWCRSYLLE